MSAWHRAALGSWLDQRQGVLHVTLRMCPVSSQRTVVLMPHSTFALLYVSKLWDAWCERLTSSVNAADACAIPAACWLACSVIVTSNSSGASLNAADYVELFLYTIKIKMHEEAASQDATQIALSCLWTNVPMHEMQRCSAEAARGHTRTFELLNSTFGLLNSTSAASTSTKQKHR